MRALTLRRHALLARLVNKKMRGLIVRAQNEGAKRQMYAPPVAAVRLLQVFINFIRLHNHKKRKDR